MNVTEEQAKTKWCPFVRFTHPANEQTDRWNNRGPELKDGADDDVHCIGSECMLWQWDEAMFDGQDSYVSEPGPTGHCGFIKQELRT